MLQLPGTGHLYWPDRRRPTLEQLPALRIRSPTALRTRYQAPCSCKTSSADPARVPQPRVPPALFHVRPAVLAGPGRGWWCSPGKRTGSGEVRCQHEGAGGQRGPSQGGAAGGSAKQTRNTAERSSGHPEVFFVLDEWKIPCGTCFEYPVCDIIF